MAKRKSAVAPSAASTPVAVGAPTPPAAALPPFLPLTHYLSVVPLQLVSLAFAFLTAANTTSQHGKVTSPAQLLAVLIARPIPTLALSCAGVLVVQAYFGLWSRTSRRNAMGLGRKASTRPKRGFWGAFEDMKAEFTAGHAPHSEAVREMKRVDLGFVGKASLVTLGAAVVLHVCAIVLGAPVILRAPETFLLSLLVALLAVMPAALAIPITEPYVWTRLVSTVTPNNDLEIALLYPALGAVIGCWSGAIPIPLDWDRPWQAWPTTCVLGAVGGHAIGSIVSLVVCSTNAANSLQKNSL